LLIRTLALFGLASKLRKYSDERIEKAKYQRQLAHLTTLVPTAKDNNTLMARINKEYEGLIESLEEYYACKIQLKQKLLEKAKNQEYYREVKAHYQQLKQRFEQQKSHWQLLHKQALCY
jgi:stearoyl-CoA desaturase (delta-9 desaturase)